MCHLVEIVHSHLEAGQNYVTKMHRQMLASFEGRTLALLAAILLSTDGMKLMVITLTSLCFAPPPVILVGP